MNKRKDGPRPAVIGTCSLSGRDINDPEKLMANGLAMFARLTNARNGLMGGRDGEESRREWVEP